MHQLDRVQHLMGEEANAPLILHRDYAIPGVETCSAFYITGGSRSGIPFSISFAGYAGPMMNETILQFAHGTLVCSLSGNGFSPYGLYAGDTASGSFMEVEGLLPNTPHDMYVRQFREAADYLLGKQEDPPIPLSWGAQIVEKLTGLCT